MKKQSLEDRLTILVCTCDAYEDLWLPFFTLLKKYWNPSVNILLNTETKQFSMEGMSVKSIKYSSTAPYGERMLHALKQVKTKYVLCLLDDFFIRKPVDEKRIVSLLDRMDEDPKIVYFNCDPTQTYYEWESNKIEGFKRIPPGNDYTLNMQAAIWRTKQLKKMWLPKVNPWEWETACNVMAARDAGHKYYCRTSDAEPFVDIGHYVCGDVWGVVRGKWIIEDVQPLFEKEGITVDFSKRGVYDPTEVKCPVNYNPPKNRRERYRQIIKYMGKCEIIRYFWFCQRCRLQRWLGKTVQEDYIDWVIEKARNQFLKKVNGGHAGVK